MRGQVFEVAKREFVTRARTRGFRAITALMVLIVVAAPIIMSLLPDNSDDLPEVALGIGADAPEGFADLLTTLAEGQFDLTIVDLVGDSPAESEDRLTGGEVDAIFEGPSTLVWDGDQDPALFSLVSAGVQQSSILDQADELGLSPAELGSLFRPAQVTNRSVDGDDDETSGVRSAVAFLGLFSAFLLPQIYGQLTMLSVVEEKSTRVVEVLLSHIRPRTLLIGKILGLCALALIQLMLLILGLALALRFTNLVEIPSALWRFVPLLGLSLLGGLAIYTTLFALLGSLISRQEDAAQVMMPVFAPLMIGYIAGQTAVFGNADTLLLKILTWFPLTAPMILPVRVAREAIGPAEVALSLALLALAVFLLIRLAGRLYEFTLLRTGSRVGWREAIRLSRGIV